MIIGIDASRAFITERTGTENYSYHLISELLRLPESQKHTFVLFIRPNAIVPKELVGYSHIIIKTIKWKYLWTQVGLAYATWMQYSSDGSLAEGKGAIKTAKLQNRTTAKHSLDVLWVPAHTLPILRNPHIKTVVTIHGLEYKWLPEYRNLLQRWYLPLSTVYAARYADRLIAVSKFTAKQLEKELHTSSKKIKVVYEGVGGEQQNKNIEYREKLYSMFNIQYSKYILFVGTIQPRKNLPTLIAAMARLSPNLAEYKLVIAGSVGWMAEEVFQAVQRNQVPDKVIFTGRISQSELAQLYLGAALYVQPSITEGFGLPILEAMQRGVPVISSDGGALTEVVGKAGMVVPLSGNTHTFVDKLGVEMQRVLQNETLRAKMVAAGKKRAKAFSWVKAAKETLAVLLNTAY